ncbi:MAG: hypothetical protein JWR65_4987 [Massilia sp.]|nr:hypothetical protein [Massilia sp.]
MALVGALRRCPLLAVLALRRNGRLAIAAWLYSVPGLRCNPAWLYSVPELRCNSAWLYSVPELRCNSSGQNHVHFHNLFPVGT